MSIIFKTDKRRVIPRWRSLKLAAVTGELSISSKIDYEISIKPDVYLVEQKEAWLRHKDLFHAADLLSSAYVLGVESEFKDVARFVKLHEQQSSDKQTSLHSLIRLANNILGEMDIQQDMDTIVDEKDTSDLSVYHTEIKRFKFYTRREPKNAIAWIELARLYSIIGLKERAKKSVEAALQLDKNNRFIVRSASRFYNHFYGDKDYALQIIKGSEFVKSDPWLLSAEIAYSSVLNRHSKMAKIGMSYLEGYKSNFLSVTELASAIGTLEYNSGNFKKAQKYFKTSLINPNDNSVAQAGWISDDENHISLDISDIHVPLAFEADASLSYKSGQYMQAFTKSLEWLEDEPYSARPVRLAAELAYTFLDNKSGAITLLRNGLKINPEDLLLSNNLVYYLAKSGYIRQAAELFKRNLSEHVRNVTDFPRIAVVATAGLVFYRLGYRERGKDFYLRAIDYAKRDGNSYLVAMATLNYIEEEIRFVQNSEEKSSLIKQLIAICKFRPEPDIQVMYRRILANHERFATTD